MDRFIPRRYSPKSNFNYSSKGYNEESTKDILDQHIEENTIISYRRLLAHVMGISKKENRFLKYMETEKLEKENEKNTLEQYENIDRAIKQGKMKGLNFFLNQSQWRVNPRVKPLLSLTNPLQVLDLPLFTAGPYMIPVGWSSRGLIAAALQGTIFLWNSEKRDTHAIQIEYYLNSPTRALKWSNNGEMLATIPKDSPKVIVFLIDKSLEPAYIFRCKCENCHLFSLEWHPSDEHIACGCSRGILTIWKLKNQNRIYSIQAHDKPICMIRSNRNGSYIMTTSPDLFMSVWHWNLTKVFTIKLYQEICCSCWHPQSDTILAIGGGINSGVSLSVWDIRGSRLIGDYKPTHSITVWSLEWSHLTGELVVGIWKRDRAIASGYGIVLILSSLDTVVDKVEATACYLMWSPDHTCIGMAGSDELLRIWQFIPPRRQKNLKAIGFQNKSVLNLFQRM